MSFKNAISMTLFFVSCITGITGTACTYANQAVNSFADVTHTHEFELSIRSSNAVWYREGMQFFAYDDTGRRWQKRTITWSLLNVPKNMSKSNAIKMLEAAFGKWAKASTLTFQKISSEEKPDIRVQFGPVKPADSLSTVKHPEGKVFDNEGVDIIFNHKLNWTDVLADDWYNIRSVALYEIGRALGLETSSNSRSILHKGSYNTVVNCKPSLGGDDINGIRALYAGSAYYDWKKEASDPSSSSSDL